MELKQHQISNIKYTKKNGESSNRVIIPNFIPGNVSAIDVTDMSKSSTDELLTRLSEYKKFTDEIRKSMLSFDQWMDATHPNEPIDGVHWRSFVAENISDPD